MDSCEEPNLMEVNYLWPLTPIRRSLNHSVDRQRHPARSAAGGGLGEGWGMLTR